MNSRAVIVHSNVDVISKNCADSNSFACIPTKFERHYITRIYVKKLISLKHCVRSQITRLKLQKSFCDLEHGASL